MALFVPEIPAGIARGRTNSCDLLNFIGGKVPKDYSSPKHKNFEDVSPVLKHVESDVPFEIFTRTNQYGKYKWENPYQAMTKEDHEQYLSQLFRLASLNNKKNWNTDSRRHIRERTNKMLKDAMERGINMNTPRGIYFHDPMKTLVI